MRNKKKKGSVLLIVIGLFSFISILILSVMSMTTTGFKLRKDESARIENFYSADSGLEIAEQLTMEIIDEAVELGNEGVKADSNLANNDEKNKVFRKIFGNHIKAQFKARVDNVKGDGITISQRYNKYKKDGQEVKVEVTKFNERELSENNEKKLLGFEIALNSNFKDSKNKERTVTVDYFLEIPDYGIISASNNKDASNLLDYLIAADGNLYMDIYGSTNLFGDIWVNGVENYNNRFERGIHINNKKNMGNKDIKVYGKLVTRGAINVDLNDAKIDFYDNTYSRDFKIQGNNNTVNKRIGNQEPTIDASLKNVLVYNDFIFEGTNTEFYMKNYYGLNDINEYEKEYTNLNLNEAERSSSVIINSNDFGTKSKVKAEQMYISGTAYIGGTDKMDVLNNYQSGESIVINRNTKPYTDRELIANMSLEEREKYLFKYKNPLHIVDKMYVEAEKDYKDINLEEKIKIVDQYYENNPEEKKNILFNGIEGNVKSTGVAYANGLMQPRNTDFDTKAQQKEFVEEVYLRNTEKAQIPIDFWERPQNVTVGGSVNWNAINNLIKRDNIYNTEDGDQNSPVDDGSGEIPTLIFNKVDLNINDSAVRENVAVFKGNKTVEDMLKGKLDVNNMSDIRGKNITMIFNNTNKDLVLSDKPHSYTNNAINVQVNHNDTITVILSRGNVEILVNQSPYNAYAITLASGDLRYILEGAANLGSFSQNQKALSEAFKKIFDFGAFDNILGGGGDGSDTTSSTTVINPSDLIKDKVWNLEK
ncbi:MAG: hypothetical protein ACRDCW_15610 [Sarcina sp.]